MRRFKRKETVTIKQSADKTKVTITINQSWQEFSAFVKTIAIVSTYLDELYDETEEPK